MEAARLLKLVGGGDETVFKPVFYCLYSGFFGWAKGYQVSTPSQKFSLIACETSSILDPVLQAQDAARGCKVEIENLFASFQKRIW